MSDFFVSQTAVNDNREAVAFVIETGGVAAGIIVRQGKVYRFYVADRAFSALDGSLFQSPKAAEKAADVVWRAAQHGAVAPPPAASAALSAAPAWRFPRRIRALD